MGIWKSSQPQLDSHIPTVPAAAAAAIPILNLPTICRPVLASTGTVQRSSYSRCFHPSVSRPAALPKLNLRGRCSVIVPANGCLAKLPLWSHKQVEGSSTPLQRFGNSQVQGDLRLPLTCTYHGCPRVSGVGIEENTFRLSPCFIRKERSRWKLPTEYCRSRTVNGRSLVIPSAAALLYSILGGFSPKRKDIVWVSFVSASR